MGASFPQRPAPRKIALRKARDTKLDKNIRRVMTLIRRVDAIISADPDVVWRLAPPSEENSVPIGDEPF